MSQAPMHKSHLISDLEWPVAKATNDEPKSIGVVLGRVSEEVEQRPAQGTSKLRPQDWTSGDRLWVVEVTAPFGGAEEMVKDLKRAVFPDREIKMMAVKDGVRDVRAV